MLGGLSFIALAVLGYMGFSPLVVVPVALACGAAWVFRPRRGHAADAVAWSWRAYLKGLPVVTAVAAAGYALGVLASLASG